MSDDVQYANLWAIHSEIDGRPAMADWAPSEEAADKRMAELKASDPDQDRTKYWVMRMTVDEVESFKASGFIPADA